MLKELRIKDRLFLILLLLWQITTCGAEYYVLSSLPDQQVDFNSAIELFTRFYPIITYIITALGSFILVWFTLYQLRKTNERLFFWLLVVNLLGLIAQALALGSSIYELHHYNDSGMYISVITTIQMYTVDVVGVISLFLSLYAFAAYAMDDCRWLDELRILKNGHIALMLTTTVLMIAYLFIPFWLAIPSRLTFITPIKILISLNPILLLWVVIWQYGRTHNLFFLLLAWAFSLDAMGCLIRNSAWYLTRAGLLSGFNSPQSVEISIQYNAIRWIIAAVISLLVLVIEAYALAKFTDNEDVIVSD